ncbi:hypothetical protein RRG08_004678 [Elysia crispata]|uniref:Uncharacterized protein n=1 Tax=Elysia crispata TaxID=231223 RepID=A0AAE1ABJ3_9GAST|nr:hypothetical protein RRG08_004678 [Elysia crispata]
MGAKSATHFILGSLVPRAPRLLLTGFEEGQNLSRIFLSSKSRCTCLMGRASQVSIEWYCGHGLSKSLRLRLGFYDDFSCTSMVVMITPQ